MFKASLPLAGIVLAACAAASIGAPPSPGAAGRSMKQIQADLQAVEAELSKINHGDSAKYNARYRQQMAREYGPLYERRDALMTEAAAATPKAASAYRHLILMDEARLAFWDVAGAQGRVDAAAADADPATATDGKLAQQLVIWWNGRGDNDAQTKVVDAIEAMGKAAPTSAPIADAMHLMLNTASLTVPLGQRLTDDLCKTMGKTPAAKAYASLPNRMAMPLAVEGTQLNGKSFKLSSFAGKVVLVDFWATWCPPCREEIPHVAKVYQQYHDQGFEIIGVSSDNDRKELASFLQQHTEMPWPELFQQGSGWHPLTKKFGIHSIPTMYLVDKGGNLRSFDGRDDMETLVPLLLAEPYTPPTKATPAKPTPGKPLSGSSAALRPAP